MNEGDSNIGFKQLYEEIIKNRKELKSTIEASEARVLLKVEALNYKVTQLEKENNELREQVEFLERNSRKNNIIIFGLQKVSEEPLVNFVRQELKRLLDTDIGEVDINNTYTLGKSNKSPIKVEFVSELKKKITLRNASKLKGTGVTISHDLTHKQREENKKLRTHLKHIKENYDTKCYIRGSKLYINNTPHTLEELDTFEEFQNLQEVNSAPATPTTQNIPQDSEFCDVNLKQPNRQRDRIIENPQGNKDTEKKIRQPSTSGTPKTGTIKKVRPTIPPSQSNVKTRSAANNVN